MTVVTLEKFDYLGLEQFVESPLNPRKTFNAAKLQELAASILDKGIIEPIVARPHAKKPDVVEIVAGARRFRAAKLAGNLTVLPVIVRDYTDAQVIEIMAIENGQRDDVPPLEEAAGYAQLLLVDKTYTPVMIAEKIGRSEKYVWDRLRLRELVDDAKALLATGRIGVEHAEIISKLKPAEQKRVIARQQGGLFTADYALEFDDSKVIGSTAYDRFKPVSVRELKQWIARNVRFDLHHAATTAPLEFADAARKVDAAQAEPGRGKHVVPITFEHMCPYGAADDKGERTYGATAWKKAVGKDGQPTCEHAVLGVVVAGRQYGDTFHVCIARDRCLVHWKESVQAKEKAAKLREQGKPKQAARAEKNTAQKQEEKWKREQADLNARQKAWDALEPHIVAEAVAQVKSIKALTSAHAKVLLDWTGRFNERELKVHLGEKWFKTPVAALLVTAVNCFYTVGFDDYVKQIAKPLGLNIKRLEAVRDQHQPKPAPAPARKVS